MKERARIDELLGSVRDGSGGVLVVRGDPGVGKTALLEYAIDRADGFRIVRLTGVEPESELGYAALHRLLAPILGQVGRLPSSQRDALNSAFGLAAGPPANPLLVGLAVIGLTADIAGPGSFLLCVVDDAQWIDSESLGVLAFWGRRLQADPVALIFGQCTGDVTTDALRGLPELDVDGLERDEARTLLISAAGFEPDRDVVERVLAETEGNPLAILELSRSLGSQMLVGRAAAPHPLPLTRRLEERFAAQVRALSPDTQLFLVLAAADASADAAMVWNAALRLGLSTGSAEAAEAADLISLGCPIRFRHPLIRSAVYGAAAPALRRSAHSALAAVTEPDDVERWVWHRAGAVVGPDEEVAALLEGCADRALANGSNSSAVALLSRAAELSPDVMRAAERRITAAEAAVERGSLGQTHLLVERAAPVLQDPAWQARAERVSGLADLRGGNLTAAASRLRLAASGLLQTDPVLGRQTLLEAVDIAVHNGDSARSELMKSVAATEVHLTEAPSSVADYLLLAFSTHARSGYVAAVPEYQRSIAFCLEAPPQALAPWTNLIAAATRIVWNEADHDLLLQRIVDWSRAQGSLLPLWLALLNLGTSAAMRGDIKMRSTLFDQAADVLSIIGPFSVPRIGTTFDALRGTEPAAFTKISSPEHRDAPSADARNASLCMQLGTGNYEQALQNARALFGGDPLMFEPHLLPDMVEAATRTGDIGSAEEALARLTERATASGTTWALGLLARSEALMGADPVDRFNAALELLGETTMEFQEARTHLLFGEWLRRARRYVDARNHLRRAHEMFAAMGSDGFVERSRVELLATGGRARPRTIDTSDNLTPQEAQISKLVGKGANNREIAAQLFISPATVEYHLHKAFRKLGVRSRTQLARWVLEKPPAP